MSSIEIPETIDIHQVIEALMKTLNARDAKTFMHSWRVAEIATLIAKDMNFSEQRTEIVHLAAHLHDIGKIGVPDCVLNKPGRLDCDELSSIQKHPVIGYEILTEIPAFKFLSHIVLHHHERYDGKGYPNGLFGDCIPLESRIIAVADTFDAITSNRSYRYAQNYDIAYQEINAHVHDQFCPLVVTSFNSIFSILPQTIKALTQELEEKLPAEFIEPVSHEDLFHSKRI